jgi:sortase A
MRRVLAATILAPLLLLTACAGGDETAAPTTSAPPTTVEATTTEAPTTVEATTTMTEATTTTEVVLPVPLPPPAPRAKEPLTELGSLEIPKLNINAPLLEGITLNTLNHGPGHWPGTALPGHVGNVVIGGHRTSHSRPFRHIDQLVPGDEVILTTPEGRFVYKVTGTQIVKPNAMWIVDQQPTYTATLFACHPVGSTKERIVVFLELTRS